jgi:hypothetical protein
MSRFELVTCAGSGDPRTARGTSRRVAILALAGAILVALSARAVAAPAPDGVDPVEEVDAVQQFLARLGLADLQALDLENVLRRDLPGERRVEIARRLADLYVGLLMSESQDEARSKEVYARVETLVKEVPEANTPSLGVLMLQAEYNRAEADACRWLREPGDTASRDAARTALAGIIPRLREHQQEIDRLVDEGWQQVRDMQDDRARAAKEEETSRLESVATRAAFLSGWANYYFALVGEQPGDASGEPPGGLAASSELATARTTRSKSSPPTGLTLRPRGSAARWSGWGWPKPPGAIWPGAARASRCSRTRLCPRRSATRPFTGTCRAW